MNKLIGILSVFFLFACADGLDRLPGGDEVLSKDKMIAHEKFLTHVVHFGPSCIYSAFAAVAYTNVNLFFLFLLSSMFLVCHVY